MWRGYHFWNHAVKTPISAGRTELIAPTRLAALAPDIPSYYGLKHSLTKAGADENGLTSFEMMLMIARGLAGTAGATDMNTAGAGAISAESDFAQLLEIVSRLSGGWADNEVLRQHLPQTYLALLNE